MAVNRMTALAILLVIEFALIAQLQGPSPTPGENGQTQEQNSNDRQPDAAVDNQVTKSPAPAANKYDPDPLPEDSKSESQKKENESNSDGWSWTTFGSFLNAVITLALAALLTRVGWRQTTLLKEQAGYMSDQSNAMRDQLKLTQDELKATNSELEISRIAADAAKTSADAAIQAVQEMRLERRPWVSITKPEIEEALAGQRMAYTVKLRNSGQTPAHLREVQYGTTVVPIEADVDAIVWQYEQQTKLVDVRNTAVAPGETEECQAVSPVVVSEEEIEAIEQGLLKLVSIGYVKYSGGESIEGLTIFCFVTDLRTKTSLKWPRHNEMK